MDGDVAGASEAKETDPVACAFAGRELTPAPMTDTSVGEANPDTRTEVEDTSPEETAEPVGSTLVAVDEGDCDPVESVIVGTAVLVLEESDVPVEGGELLLLEEAGAWVQLCTSWKSGWPSTVIGVRVTVQVSVIGPDDPWIVLTVTTVTGEPF